MTIDAMVSALHAHAADLQADAVAAIDFVQLQRDLEAAAALITELDRRAEIGRRLLANFRDELLNRACAVAKLTGRSARLTEKLILAESTTLDELLALKDDIDREFDHAFARTLTASRRDGTSDGARLEPFKVGKN